MTLDDALGDTWMTLDDVCRLFLNLLNFNVPGEEISADLNRCHYCTVSASWSSKPSKSSSQSPQIGTQSGLVMAVTKNRFDEFRGL